MEDTYKILISILNYLLTNLQFPHFTQLLPFFKKKENQSDLAMLRKKPCSWFVSTVKLKSNNLSLPQNKAILWPEKGIPMLSLEAHL